MKKVIEENEYLCTFRNQLQDQLGGKGRHSERVNVVLRLYDLVTVKPV